MRRYGAGPLAVSILVGATLILSCAKVSAGRIFGLGQIYGSKG